MDKASKPLLFSCILFALLISSGAQNCNSYGFTNNRQFRTCNELPVLSSSLHWNLDESTNTVEIAFRHRGATSSRWVAWALNPTGQQMVGSQAIVTYQNSTGIRAYTSNVAQIPPTLEESRLSFGVSNIEATMVEDVMTIYARLQLTNELLSTNQVWQEGPLSGGNPAVHPITGDNVRSVGTIDFRTGQTGSGGGTLAARQRRRNTHGILNAVSWGTLMPLGIIIARYLRVFKVADRAWFYLHAACQSSAYVVGIAGWALGLKLGEESVSIQYKTHRAIGITLFCLGTLQVFALLLRPKPDHKYRTYWNIYHHAIGYGTISLSIVNVYQGLDILAPGEKWRWVYSGVLIFLGALALTLEVITWIIVIKRKKKQDNIQKQNPHSINGVNGGTNGYGA